MANNLAERFDQLSPLVDDAVQEFMRRIAGMSHNMPEHALSSAYGVSQIMQASNLFALNSKDTCITREDADYIVELLNRKADVALGTLVEAIGSRVAGVAVQ